MSSSDGRRANVRSTSAYRAAVRSARLTFLTLLGWLGVLAWSALRRGLPPSGLGPLVVFLAGAVSGVVALVLLHRSGFLSRRTQAENPQLNREFFRDLVRPGRW